MAQVDDWYQKTPLPPQLPLPEHVRLPYGWAPHNGAICRVKRDAAVMPPRRWTWSEQYKCEVDQDGFNRKGIHVKVGANVYGWFPHDYERKSVEISMTHEEAEERTAEMDALVQASLERHGDLQKEEVEKLYPRYNPVLAGHDNRYRDPTLAVKSDEKRPMAAFDLSTEGGRYDKDNKDGDGRDLDSCDSYSEDEDGNTRSEHIANKGKKPRYRDRTGKPRTTGNPPGRPKKSAEGPAYYGQIDFGCATGRPQSLCKGKHCKEKKKDAAYFAPDPKLKPDKYKQFAEAYKKLGTNWLDASEAHAALEDLSKRPQNRPARSNEDQDIEDDRAFWERHKQLTRPPAKDPSLKTLSAASCLYCRRMDKDKKAVDAPKGKEAMREKIEDAVCWAGVHEDLAELLVMKVRDPNMAFDAQHQPERTAADEAAEHDSAAAYMQQQQQAGSSAAHALQQMELDDDGFSHLDTDEGMDALVMEQTRELGLLK